MKNMKITLSMLAVFIFVPILAQDTTVQKTAPTQKRVLTPEQIQFQKDVLYVVKNARKAYVEINEVNKEMSRVNTNVNNINNSVNKIIHSNQKLWDQNDSLRIIQYRILNYAKQSEDRALKAEAQKISATRESESWSRMLDLTTIIGAMGAISLLIGFNAYNTYQLNKIKRKLTV